MDKMNDKETVYVELDDYEQEIEDNFEDLKPYTGKKLKTEIAIAKKAAENYMRKKTLIVDDICGMFTKRKGVTVLDMNKAFSHYMKGKGESN